MKTNKPYGLMLLAVLSAVMTACVHEFPVTDHSFSFKAEVTYDESEDRHLLTLTRNTGEKGNQYNIAFTLDGKPGLSLEDMDGRVHEGRISESFDDISARTYTLSKVEPGEHTLNLEISTESYSEAIDILFMVEDFSFLFDCQLLFDKEKKTHALEVTLEKGSPSDRYTIAYTIDNQEPWKSHQETFSDRLTRTFDLPQADPGEHTLNIVISTGKHSQKLDIPFTVTDYSFEVKADIEYDSDNLSHILFLTLVKGSRDETYTVSYTVDGGHSVTLTDVAGHELGASFTESFKDATVKSYDMSRVGIGKHTMKLVVSTDDYFQEIEVPYEVKAIPFSIHSEIDPSGSATKMMLSLGEGDKTTTYDVSILYDGQVIKGYDHVEVNFSSTPIKTLILPLLRPGKHEVSIDVTDGYTTESEKMNYSEPVRHPYVDITLKHNESNGKHIAMIGDNPYGIELSLKTMLTLTGTSTYCISTYEYYESDFIYKTKTKLMSDSSSLSDDYDDISVTLIDRDALAAKMTSSYEMSNVMEYCCNPGDGENSDQIWWQSFKQERAYYKITKEELKIEISGEKVTGVTLRVKNEIGSMTLNGKSNSSGTTNIAL